MTLYLLPDPDPEPEQPVDFEQWRLQNDPVYLRQKMNELYEKAMKAKGEVKKLERAHLRIVS